MRDDAFEWDDEKAARNWQQHGITFEMAREAFADAFAVEWIDEDHSDEEERIAMLAMVADDRLLFVSYTLRGDRNRIISARKAEPDERLRYHTENA